jgi:hypothetical protein
MTENESDEGASLLCQWCDEPVTELELRLGGAEATLWGQVTHIECGLRSVVGSVGHQAHRCSCHGGTEEDPPGMTRREAARAAMTYFQWRHPPARSHQPE